ncbi:cytochrome P450 [Streptomyces sp. NPDC002476]|uniref:cytochrome P450 n=1 Tax=Streptomyces sp. NPDC002476 TaxID=3364648 RepID=UPI00367FB42F
MTSEAAGTDRTLDFPAARAAACPFDPPPAYQHALRTEPVARARLWDGSTCWLVTGYPQVRSMLGDRRLSADVRVDGFPLLSRGRRELVNRSAPSFIRLDDLEHARQRHMLTGDFIVRRVEAMRPQIQQVVDEALDRMIDEGGPADLVTAFAVPVSSLVICRLLGLPHQDHAFFRTHSRVLADIDSDTETLRASITALTGYLTDVAQHKRRSPDESVLGHLAAREDISVEEVASMGRLLLTAGQETTAEMTTLGTLALLRNPEQAELLCTEPELTKGAVEELLRYLSIVHLGVPRVAVEDIDLDGTLIRAGEGVLLMLSTANRDAGPFPDGDRLDITRDARHHLAFSFGAHQCLGQSLVRAELQTTLPTLFRRLPGLRLVVPFAEVTYRTDMVYGVNKLPVSW